MAALSTRPFAARSDTAGGPSALETFERPSTPTLPSRRHTGHAPDGAGCEDTDPAWRGL
ncbi:hypothetical protein [Streptomyces sp. NPDC089919]|uniref:hypothetical protein n=1 Tax=Streptomyces sp. NPDC089919 TaxID=3155188 RepID=UPI00341C71BF